MILHLKEQNIFAFKQKGIMLGSKGPKSQLLIDKMVCKDSRKRTKNLAVAWVNFQKAFDSVPHSWLLEVLQFTSLVLYFLHFFLCQSCCGKLT